MMKPDYSYQEPLVKKILALLQRHHQAVLAACPSAGKTKMAKDVVEALQKKNKKFKTLILTHGQTLLRDQWDEYFASQEFPFGIIVHSKMAAQTIENHSTILSLPQTLCRLKEMPKVDLVICDEGHQRFLQGQVQRILELVKPTYQLVLTGTPSPFLGQKDWPVAGITIEELLEYGTVTDPLIEIVQMDYKYSLQHYDKNRMNLSESALDLSSTKRNLDALLPQMVDKLTHRNRSNPERYEWREETKNWPSLIKRLKKTMIVCNSQRHAIAVDSYFKVQGIKTALSVYSQGVGTKELNLFINDETVQLFIVVNRGTLGFSFTELFNIIDMSGSLNVNRLFQQICRLIRPSKFDPNQSKVYIKTTNAKLAPLTYFIMSYVVALSSKEYYYSYHTDFDVRKIPVDLKFLNLIGEEKKESSGDDFPDLPQLFTFKEMISKSKDNKCKTIAYATLRSVIDKVKKKSWDSDEVEALARRYSSRMEFYKNQPGAYSFMLRNRQLSLLDEIFGKKTEHTKESVLALIKQCHSIVSFRKRYPGAYTWLKRKKELGMLDQLATDMMIKTFRRVTSADGLIEELLADPDYEIFPDGRIFYKNGNKAMRHKRNYWSMRYKNGAVALSRVLWRKFYGAIPSGHTVVLKDPTQRPSIDNIEVVGAKQKVARDRAAIVAGLHKSEKHKVSNAKITKLIAEQIRQDHKEGLSYPRLMEKYGLAKSTVSYVVTHRTWA